MTKRFALGVFLVAVLIIAAAYASAFLPGDPPAWAAWALAAGTCLSIVAMMGVGAARHGRIGRRLTAAFGLVLLVVGGGFGALLALPPADPGDPALWLGLPPRAAVLLYGVGVLPFFIVPVAYAWTFDELTLSASDLERVRASTAGPDTGPRSVGTDADSERVGGGVAKPGGAS